MIIRVEIKYIDGIGKKQQEVSYVNSYRVPNVTWLYTRLF